MFFKRQKLYGVLQNHQMHFFLFFIKDILLKCPICCGITEADLP